MFSGPTKYRLLDKPLAEKSTGTVLELVSPLPETLWLADLA